MPTPWKFLYDVAVDAYDAAAEDPTVETAELDRRQRLIDQLFLATQNGHGTITVDGQILRLIRPTVHDHITAEGRKTIDRMIEKAKKTKA